MSEYIGKITIKGFKDIYATIYKGDEIITKVFFLPSNQSVFTTHAEYIKKAEMFIDKSLKWHKCGV